MCELAEQSQSWADSGVDIQTKPILCHTAIESHFFPDISKYLSVGAQYMSTSYAVSKGKMKIITDLD